MKKRLFLAILAVALVLAGTTVAGASILYVNTFDGTTSSLYTLTTTGTATKVGDIQEDGTTNRQFTDIAYDQTTGTMYAITTTTLYTLDLTPSGGIITATAVGSTGVTGLQGLEVNSSGTIYADSFYSGFGSNQFGHLYTLNNTTGAATDIGGNGAAPGSPSNNNYGNYGDLAFVDSTLYGTLAEAKAAGVFWGTINISTGAATATSPTTAMSDNIDGLAYVDPTLYGIS
ncbi:MAG: hypothetical protein P8X58_06540, partial [Syntrophobacterales bacterium]